MNYVLIHLYGMCYSLFDILFVVLLGVYSHNLAVGRYYKNSFRLLSTTTECVLIPS